MFTIGQRVQFTASAGEKLVGKTGTVKGLPGPCDCIEDYDPTYLVAIDGEEDGRFESFDSTDLEPAEDDNRDLLAALDEDYFYPPTEQERLKQVGAPVWMWADMELSRCCEDGLCSECESVI